MLSLVSWLHTTGVLNYNGIPVILLTTISHLFSHAARGLTDKQGGDGTKYQAFLLFNEKQSFRKLGEIIYHQSQSGEIYVRRDALTVAFDSGRILYSNIITYGGSGLRQLWGLVFADGSTLLGKGLVAFGLQNSAIVWIRGRPDGLGDVSGMGGIIVMGINVFSSKNSFCIITNNIFELLVVSRQWLYSTCPQ